MTESAGRLLACVVLAVLAVRGFAAAYGAGWWPVVAYGGGVALLLAWCGVAVAFPPPARAAALPDRVRRRADVTQRVLTALVWAAPVALYGYAAVVSIVVGHWPSSGQPDPKVFPVLYGVVASAFLCTMIALPAWAFAFPLCSRLMHAPNVPRQAIAFAAGVVAIAVTCVSDPAGVLDWVAD